MLEIPSFLVIIFQVYVLLTIVFLLLDNRDTPATIAWILVIIIFPIFGLMVYFLIGRSWHNPNKEKRIVRKHVDRQLGVILEPLLRLQEQLTRQVGSTDGTFHKNRILQLLYKNSNSILTTKNKIDILQSGQTKFDRLYDDLRRAKHSIHMEYYIWRQDKLTAKFQNLLIEKVREGVSVRLLYDAVGCILLKNSFIKKLRKGGVEIFPYYDFRSPFTFHTLNYRNHRKIVVIDGKIGYTGGMNMGQEYVDGGKCFDFWRDTHVRVEGEAVLVLQSIFLASWLITTKEDLFSNEYFPLDQPEQTSYLPIQITKSGPDSEWHSIQQLYFTLITSAEKSVYIQSPYFVPDKSVELALKTAALSGLDVKLMMTGVPDKKLPFWSAHTFFKELLKAGVKIYQYKKGFFHSKSISVDGEISSVGTANMDMRSFHLNYEINILFYDKTTTRNLIRDFENDLKDCRKFTMEDYNNLNHAEKFRNSIARLFAPML